MIQDRKFNKFLRDNDAFWKFYQQVTISQASELQKLNLSERRSDIIDIALIWDSTIEGFDFWCDLSELWERKCTNINQTEFKSLVKYL